MKKFYNPKYSKELRNYLRKNSTPAEKILWKLLKGWKLLGYKFHRQYGIYRYIVDFYCPKAKLVIELDGNQHDTKTGLKYDKVREELMKGLEIKTIRFRNREILEDIDRVVKKIEEELSM